MRKFLSLVIVLAAVSSRADSLNQLVALAGADAPPAPVVPPVAVLRVELDKARIVFDDGDTVAYSFSSEDGVFDKEGKPYNGELRLMGFDTPETFHPQHGIFYDQPYGPEASALTKKLVAEAKVIEVVTTNRFDFYGRLLTYLLIDGRQLGALQIEAGLAYEAVLKYPDDHKDFPEMFAEITAAWDRSPISLAIRAGVPGAVVEPSAWRCLNQRKRNVTPEEWKAMPIAEQEEIVATAELTRNACPRPIQK